MTPSGLPRRAAQHATNPEVCDARGDVRPPSSWTITSSAAKNRTRRTCAARSRQTRQWRLGAAGEGESPYFCVFEADFDDAAAMGAARGSTEGQAVRADVPNYATGGVVVLDYELRGG
jgi:hypothetical protein